MTEHTLAQMRALQSRLTVNLPVELEVQFGGGDQTQMQSWLGADLDYHPQSDGDLGDRMAAAFERAFIAGSTAVLLIGSDCPELDALLLEKAFRELQRHDLVLGPAADGGYYLIGLRRSIPALFQGIAWSTDAVRQQTLAIAQKLGLTIAKLPMLSDVDYPADLEIWQRASRQISVIIPTLNEAAHLHKTLITAQLATQVEVIVVDGGSQDATIDLAQSLQVRVSSSPPNRAHQMNHGAAMATGDILLFLHADTTLPFGYDSLIRQALSQPGVVAGAFELEIHGTTPGLRLVEWGVGVRSRLLQLPYGDQALFISAKQFHAIGGFPNLPIMEDFELVRRLRTQGKVAIVPAAVVTSGRRWHKLGSLRTTLLNQWVILAYLFGVPPERIARWYRGSGQAKP